MFIEQMLYLFIRYKLFAHTPHHDLIELDKLQPNRAKSFQLRGSSMCDISSILKQCNRKNMKKGSQIITSPAFNMSSSIKSSNNIKTIFHILYIFFVVYYLPNLLKVKIYSYHYVVCSFYLRMFLISSFLAKSYGIFLSMLWVFLSTPLEIKYLTTTV